MPTPNELEKKFWKSLKSDRTVMLGLVRLDDGHARPMTAQIEGDEGGPIWFFTSNKTELVSALKAGDRAMFTFSGKGGDLFASVHGALTLDNDRAAIERLWNPFVAAWYEGGKDDPELALLRFDPDRGEIWENGHSFIAGLMMLAGRDPKKDYGDKVAEVDLS